MLTGESDPLGNHTVIQTDPDGAIRFADRLGRTTLRHVATDGKVEKVVRPGGSAIVGGYDPQRNLVAVTDAAGNVSRLEYDPLNRPVRYTDAAGASATKAYDPVGNVIEIVNRNGKRRTFEHDANNGITHERWHGPDGAVVRDFAYAYFHGALRQVADGSSSWDILGALPRPSQVSVAHPGQVRRNVLYNWERNGVAGPGGGTSDAATGQVTRYRYDHRNQLVLATVHPDAGAPAATTVAFEYDYAGRMMSRSVDGAKTWIVYDRQMPVAEFADGADAVNAAFLYSPDRLDDFHAVWRAGTGVRLLLKDHMGTVLGATDAAGKLAWWRDVDAFGNPRAGQLAGDEPLGFAGRFHNAALGLYEMRARFYDPWLGRFTQEDPLEFAGGDMNLYGYAGNNPLMRNDPTGKLAALEYAALIQDIASTLDARCTTPSSWPNSSATSPIGSAAARAVSRAPTAWEEAFPGGLSWRREAPSRASRDTDPDPGPGWPGLGEHRAEQLGIRGRRRVGEQQSARRHPGLAPGPVTAGPRSANPMGNARRRGSRRGPCPPPRTGGRWWRPAGPRGTNRRPVAGRAHGRPARSGPRRNWPAR